MTLGVLAAPPPWSWRSGPRSAIRPAPVPVAGDVRQQLDLVDRYPVLAAVLIKPAAPPVRSSSLCGFVFGTRASVQRDGGARVRWQDAKRHGLCVVPLMEPVFLSGHERNSGTPPSSAQMPCLSRECAPSHSTSNSVPKTSSPAAIGYQDPLAGLEDRFGGRIAERSLAADRSIPAFLRALMLGISPEHQQPDESNLVQESLFSGRRLLSCRFPPYVLGSPIADDPSTAGQPCFAPFVRARASQAPQCTPCPGNPIGVSKKP